MNYNKYSKDVHSIIDNLSKKESNHIGNGYWVDSDHIIYRKVEYMDNKPIGFIDVYSLPKFKRYGLIIIAVSKDARGKGIGRKLVNSAIQNCKNNKDIDKLRWKADSDNLASINMAKSLGFRLINNTEKEKEFIYDLKDDENMSDLYENINEGASDYALAALGGYAILSKVYKDYLDVKFDKENYGPDLIGFKKVGLSMLKSKRINEDGTVDHPTKLIDILEKYDKQFYEKYKNKVIIACKGATTVNNQLFDPFYITVLIASTDNKMTPIDFKYIPVHPIAKKYQEYYIFTSYLNVILYCDNGNHCDEIISLIDRRYPKAKEYNDKLQEYYDNHNIIKKIFNKKKPKKTDDKSTTNTKDKNKTSKETNVNESTLPSKERNKLDDDTFGIPSLRKYPLNDNTQIRLSDNQALWIYGDRSIIVESCKDVETARKFLQEVDNLSKKYDANFFIVTDGASMTRNGRGKSEPAVKNARDKQIEWEKKNGGNPDEDWLKHINESTLPSKERRKLDDDVFGIPSLRKYPLNDKAHVLAAIRMFNRVDRKHEKELAHNIIAAMEKYKISKDIIGPKNRLQSYI